MNKFIFSILLSGLFACNQKTETVDKTNCSKTKDTSKLYSIAIEEYLKAVSKKNKPDIDSLFVGQYDDLKNIKLPEAILNTKIILLTSYDEGTKKLIYRKSFDFVNIAPHNPLVSKTQAEFIFIRFLTEKSNKELVINADIVKNLDDPKNPRSLRAGLYISIFLQRGSKKDFHCNP